MLNVGCSLADGWWMILDDHDKQKCPAKTIITWNMKCSRTNVTSQEHLVDGDSPWMVQFYIPIIWGLQDFPHGGYVHQCLEKAPRELASHIICFGMQLLNSSWGWTRRFRDLAARRVVTFCLLNQVCFADIPDFGLKSRTLGPMHDVPPRLVVAK